MVSIGTSRILRSSVIGVLAIASTLSMANRQGLALSSGNKQEAISTRSTQIRREFRDPNLGLRWQLLEDAGHPERPGRLVIIPGVDLPTIPKETAGRSSASPIVIQAGARVTVDQETPRLHARLQALALESGCLGERIRVRLSLGANQQQGVLGKIVLATVTGDREARWMKAEGERP